MSEDTAGQGGKDALGALRQEIDALDRQIVRLLDERGRLVERVGADKAERGAVVFAPDREAAVLANVTGASQGPLTASHLRAIYREILSAMRSLERAERIGYMGPAATFTHQAALERFGAAAEYVALPSIPDTFLETARGGCDYGVVPVENSTEGPVHETLDAFVDSELKVVSEIILPIHHQLVARCAPEAIRTVFTNPVALGQCRRWLSTNLPGREIVQVVSTARAAAQAAETPASAAISPRLAAEVYGLDVVAADIEDFAQNYTRFYVLARELTSRPTGDDKTALLFSIRDRVGALRDVVALFAQAGVNLSSIQSRPSRRRAWDYVFFVELQGHAADPKLQAVLRAVEQHCAYLKVLGAWPRAEAAALA
ncbi:MAG TPA: prephenate dehydratase [Chloroflexota bacterium]|nr:prephenate dehydratase [Chloroflexota bacterium]